MNEYHETHKQTHVIPILVTLTDEEWYDVQKFFLPEGILFFECTRHTLEDESMMARDSNFGDFIRWLFKLAPTDKNIPVDLIIRRVRDEAI